MNSKIIAQGAEAIITLDKNNIIKNRTKKSYRIPFLDEKIRKSRTKAEAKIINKLSSIIPVPKIIKTDDKQEIIMEYIDGKKLSDNLEQLDYKSICKLMAENITKMHDAGIIHGDLTTSNMIYVENSEKNKTADYLSQQSTNLKNLDINKNKSAKSLSMRKRLSNNNQPNENEATNSSTVGGGGEQSHFDKNIQNNKVRLRDWRAGKVYFIDFGLAFHSSKIEDKAVDLHLLQQALEAKHFTVWQECFKIILDNYKPEKYKEILARIKTIESRGRYKDKY